MAGQDVNESHNAMKQAIQRIKQCRMVFMTCIGSGLGLLRSEDFDIVIIDEASQQTEPASLVPLVKGCMKAVLVGDHVQLRPTVQQVALLVQFDVSLFERLYSQESGRAATKLMLDTQYRMHPSICSFSSTEFYQSNLRTGISPGDRPLFHSMFPWPNISVDPDGRKRQGGLGRMVFVECAAQEDFGQKSKSNQGQAELCAHICKMLCTPSSELKNGNGVGAERTDRMQSIAVLTPYTRQAELLKKLLSGLAGSIEVSSIDAFQGKEADIVVFVTVRCNELQNIGFLKDTRRMNVALTRSRAGMIVIGNRVTLTEGKDDPESTAMWQRLLTNLSPVVVELPAGK